ncbi:MAG: hypothetical protein ACOX8W_11450 [bacterium]|jgi:hypothetical protein
MVDFALYRTAHGAFPESVEGEFVAFVLPPDAPLATLAPVIQNALVLRLPGAIHLLHLMRVFDLLPDRRYRDGKFSLILDGTEEPVSSDRCAYCLHYSRQFGQKCESCEPALAEKYRNCPYRHTVLLNYLDAAGGRRLTTVLLHKDETFVHMRSEDIAEGRLRGWGDSQQGYSPLHLTFDRDIIRRNELIFNAEMAERTGRMQALKFEND